jgi:hypothetical protein
MIVIKKKKDRFQYNFLLNKIDELIALFYFVKNYIYLGFFFIYLFLDFIYFENIYLYFIL